MEVGDLLDSCFRKCTVAPLCEGIGDKEGNETSSPVWDAITTKLIDKPYKFSVTAVLIL